MGWLRTASDQSDAASASSIGDETKADLRRRPLRSFDSSVSRTRAALRNASSTSYTGSRLRVRPSLVTRSSSWSPPASHSTQRVPSFHSHARTISLIFTITFNLHVFEVNDPEGRQLERDYEAAI